MINEKVVKAESDIIKVLLKHTGELSVQNHIPYDFMEPYLELLIEDENKSELLKVKKATIFFCNDSFYTTANLLYSSKNVCLACALMALQIMKFEIPSSKNYDMDSLMKRIIKKCETKVMNSDYWYKMIDLDLDLEAVTEIIKMVNEFYTKIKIK